MNASHRSPRPARPLRTAGRFLPALVLSTAVHAGVVAVFSIGGVWVVRGAGSGGGLEDDTAIEVRFVRKGPPADAGLGDPGATPDVDPSTRASFGPDERPADQVLVDAETELDVTPPKTEGAPPALELPEALSADGAAAGSAKPRAARGASAGSAAGDAGEAPVGWDLAIRRDASAGGASETRDSRAVASEEAGTSGTPAVVGPRLRGSPAPRYPSESIRAGEEGTVLCRLYITAEGGVSEVVILESSGHPRLDRAAREALLRWRFEPRLESGRPVPAVLDHPVEFVLTGGQ